VLCGKTFTTETARCPEEILTLLFRHLTLTLSPVEAEREFYSEFYVSAFNPNSDLEKKVALREGLWA